jgi:uncharacterized protein with HEPN domain
MSKRPDIHLELALRALERVPRFLAGRSLQAYLADDLCQSAVERQLEVAGDALGQVRSYQSQRFRPEWLTADPALTTRAQGSDAGPAPRPTRRR